MKNTEYTLTINGKTYPARYTLGTAIRAAERRGGDLSGMFGNKNQAEFISDMAWLAAEMIGAEAARREYETGEKAGELPTEEEILATVDFADLLELQGQMLTVINKDRPTVKAEVDEKNAEAAPGE